MVIWTYIQTEIVCVQLVYVYAQLFLANDIQTHIDLTQWNSSPAISEPAVITDKDATLFRSLPHISQSEVFRDVKENTVWADRKKITYFREYYAPKEFPMIRARLAKLLLFLACYQKVLEILGLSHLRFAYMPNILDSIQVKIKKKQCSEDPNLRNHFH